MVKSLIPWKKKKDLPVIRQESSDPFTLLQREVNALFEDFFDRSMRPAGWMGSNLPAWPGFESGPGFEVTESDDAVHVKAELPGMDEKDIDVTIDDNILTIRGEKKEERSEKKHQVVVSELRYGQFHRTIPLPSEIDREKAKATFKKGVLTLELPKVESEKTERKRIAISTD